jgi:hypothetical protein
LSNISKHGFNGLNENAEFGSHGQEFVEQFETQILCVERNDEQDILN